MPGNLLWGGGFVMEKEALDRSVSYQFCFSRRLSFSRWNAHDV